MNAINQNMDLMQTSAVTLRSRTIEKPDTKTASKQVETLFLNEMLRIMLEQTSIGQDKTISVFLPAITSEVAKSMAERGIGLGEFLTRDPSKVEGPASGMERRPSGIGGSQRTSGSPESHATFWGAPPSDGLFGVNNLSNSPI